MYNITSVKNIPDTQWSDYFKMFQELNKNYYPERYDEHYTLQKFKENSERNYLKITGYDEFIIQNKEQTEAYFYITNWGDVLYSGLYVNDTEVDPELFRYFLKHVSNIMYNMGYTEFFSASYRKANVDKFRKVYSKPAEEFISSRLMRSEIDTDLYSGIINDFCMDDYETLFCSKIDDRYAESYLECFNIAFKDLMDLNDMNLKYEPLTKEKMNENYDPETEKRILLLLHNNTIAGFTEINHDKKRKILKCDNGFTAVLPSYRGKGIGKFLKAKMYYSLLNEDFIFDSITTNTLIINRYINDINTALGFKEYRRSYSFRFYKQQIENYLNNIE